MFTEQLSQGLSIAAPQVQPQTLNNASASTGSGGVDLAKFRRALFVVQVGSVTAGGSLTAKLQESATGTGSWSDISGSTITAITASNKVATLEVRADQLSAGKRYVRCTLTEGGSQNVVCSCLPLGAEAVQKPGN